MRAKLYGPEHIIFLVCCLVVFAAVIVVAVLVCKTEKRKTILIKSVAAVLLVTIVANRISLAVWNNNGIGALELLPNTYCGMTSLLLAIFVLIGKPHDKVYDFFLYVEIIGGLATLFYSNFLDQGPTFMFFPTITGMVHHAIGILLCILLCLCGWFAPSLKRWKIFPIGMSAYTLYGLFLLDVLKIPHTMQIDDPMIPGTPLKWWFVLTVGTALVAGFSFIFEFVKKRIVAKKQSASSSETPEIAE